MGSSVFHGGFSTFLAIVLTAPSKSYVFIIFFRLWFSIILFGMGNGFMLLPVILSYIGPTYTPKQKAQATKAPTQKTSSKVGDFQHTTPPVAHTPFPAAESEKLSDQANMTEVQSKGKNLSIQVTAPENVLSDSDMPAAQLTGKGGASSIKVN